jgi:hypothetical protein
VAGTHEYAGMVSEVSEAGKRLLTEIVQRAGNGSRPATLQASNPSRGRDVGRRQADNDTGLKPQAPSATSFTPKTLGMDTMCSPLSSCAAGDQSHVARYVDGHDVRPRTHAKTGVMSMKIWYRDINPSSVRSKMFVQGRTTLRPSCLM